MNGTAISVTNTTNRTGLRPIARGLPLLLALVLLLTTGRVVLSADLPPPLIGAIRWDAWHVGGESAPVRAMERALGPDRYHYRLPFFAKVISENEVKIDGYTQEIMDREIGFAKSGGIDYWAFLLYDLNTPMSQGLSLYLSSPRKREMPFCAIATRDAFGDAKAFPEKIKRVLDLMAEPTYQKVMVDRPLLYLYDVSDYWLQLWGGEENAGKLMSDFRAAVKARGLNDPYIVVMDVRPSHGKKVADLIGADAISAYAAPGDGGQGSKPYSALAENAKRFWESCAETGAQVVPTVMAGWDRRPRIEHPVPWEKSQKPGEGMDRYYKTPTPQELVAHIKDAVQWIAAKKSICPAQTMIIYAWNEHDEGGWLCPTLNPDGTANTERLDAIAAMRPKPLVRR